jgi:hypothetical protein
MTARQRAGSGCVPCNKRPDPVPYPDAALGDGSGAAQARAWFWWGYGAVCGGVHVMPPEWGDQRRWLWAARWGVNTRPEER